MQKTEEISIKTVDSRIIDGEAKLYDKKRVSDFFGDENIVFIDIINTLDNHGTKKNETFINKDLMVWVEPKELIKTNNKQYIDTINYKDITLKVSGGTILNGKINMGDSENIGELLYKDEKHLPFIILRDVVDSHENRYHTLFVNKKFVIELEELIL